MITRLVVILILCFLLFLNFLFIRLLGVTFDIEFWKSVAINLAPNIFGLIIAIFAVDSIIRIKRRASFSKLNNRKSQEIAFQTNRFLLDILVFLGLEESEAHYLRSIKQRSTTEEAFRKFTNDIGLDFIVEDMRKHLTQGSFGKALLKIADTDDFGKKVDGLHQVLEKGSFAIKKHLIEVKPYPADWLHKLIEEDFIEVLGVISVSSRMDKDIFHSKEMNATEEQIRALRSSLLVEIGNKLQVVCLEFTYLSEKARKNKLFDIID